MQCLKLTILTAIVAALSACAGGATPEATTPETSNPCATAKTNPCATETSNPGAAAKTNPGATAKAVPREKTNPCAATKGANCETVGAHVVLLLANGAKTSEAQVEHGVKKCREMKFSQAMRDCLMAAKTGSEVDACDSKK